MPAQLPHEPSSVPEGAEGTRNRRIRIVLDPVQDGIGEDCVEFVVKDQRSGIHYPRVEAAPKSGCNHVGRTVDAHHLRTQRSQLFGQCAVAATQIKDALARLGVEQIQHRLTERRHEMGIIGIRSRIPMLGRC
jgi:hypothetical protein